MVYFNDLKLFHQSFKLFKMKPDLKSVVKLNLVIRTLSALAIWHLLIRKDFIKRFFTSSCDETFDLMTYKSFFWQTRLILKCLGSIP